MTATTALEYVALASTEERDLPADPIAYCWDVLGYTLVKEGEASEEAVLTTPAVQEALQRAIDEFEEWKNSL